MIYIYAIAETGGGLPQAVTGGMTGGVTGIEGARPALLEYRDIAAVVSAISVRRIDPNAVRVWQHESVVERLMDERAVLPVRYGTVLEDERVALDMLAAHYEAFVTNLERVRGRVELSLRVMWDDGGPDVGPDAGPDVCAAEPPAWIPALAGMTGAVPDSPSRADGEGLAGAPQAVGERSAQRRGRVYMETLLQKDRDRRVWRQRGQAHVDAISAVLAGLVTQQTQKTFVTPHLLLTAACLVERRKTGEFLRAVERLAQDNPALHLLCTGPWPPYNFVDVSVDVSDDVGVDVKGSIK